MEEGCYELKIDPELKMAMPPLSDTEYRELEENIKDNGCHSPIIVWNGVIVDGHNRYKICHENNIPFYVEEKQFESKADAKLWMLKEQLSRRNLSDVQRVFACLDMEPELLEEGRRRMGHKDDDALIKRSNHNTREIVAEMASASPVMVQRIKKIKQCADKQTIEDVYWGRVKVYTAWKKVNVPQKQEKQVVPNTSVSIRNVDAGGDDTKDTVGNSADLEECQLDMIEQSSTPEDLIGMSQEICERFVREMKALLKRVDKVPMKQDMTLSIMRNIADAASLMAESVGWLDSFSVIAEEDSEDLTEDEKEMDFQTVTTIEDISSKLYKSNLNTALFYLDYDHFSKEKMLVILNKIEETHQEILKKMQTGIESAGEASFFEFNCRDSLEVMLKACTDADDETIRRCCNELVSVKTSGTNEVITPASEYSAAEMIKSISSEYAEKINWLVENTNPYYLTRNVIQYAQESIDNANTQSVVAIARLIMSKFGAMSDLWNYHGRNWCEADGSGRALECENA